MAALTRLFPVVLLALAMLAGTAAWADTPITLFKSFAGNISMTGTQKTMRTKANGSNACSIASSVTMNLSGLPNNSTVLAAYLYWAGSGSKTDYEVKFDGKTITAPVTRRYASDTVGYNFFGGAADVTDQVKARGNGNYTASDLGIDTSTFYCAPQAVLGGFQLLVVYSHSAETFRVLNVYEGFQYIQYSSVELTLANFLTPNPIGNLTGRVGHITWEGDSTLSGGGETLRYNGVEQVDLANPSGNQFNSVSNVNVDFASYGIDFDVYTVRSPVIGSGQKSAKTLYTSGQDLVLLNAEVVAAPNVPATDRGVTMTLNGSLVPSAATTYTISVVNNGPMDEGGPLTVTGTLPGSLIYGGATGTGWTCRATGQLLTCTYGGLVKSNATLPPITLTVTPAASASGLITFGVTVAGKLFDYYDGNDTSTVSTRVGAQNFTPVFIFTNERCVHNKPFGDPEQTCAPLDLKQHPANKDINTWITYVVKNVPTALASANSTLPMRFAFSCHNPSTSAGTTGTYNLRSATVTIPACAANGVIPAQSSSAWSSVSNILYPGGSPSSQASTVKTATDPDDFLLRYADVGRIELFVTDNQARLGSTGAFVSRPDRLLLLAQSNNKAGDPASATDPRFVPAGSPFEMTVRAMMLDSTTPAPNFGRESDPEAVKIRLAVTPAPTADGSLIFAMADGRDITEELKLAGSFGPFVKGIATGSDFIFDDVGVIKAYATLEPTDNELAQDRNRTEGSYLGSGNLIGSILHVGRFYPHHFNTIVTGTMGCMIPARCPVDGTPKPATPARIATMAYAGQPFTVEVHAMNAQDKPLANYRHELARTVLLSAWKAPNGATAQAAPLSGLTGSVMSNATIAATAFREGVGKGTPTYTFPAALAYRTTAPGANNWSQPVSVYIRAAEPAGTDETTSKRTPAAVEGGVQVVAGRLFVPDLTSSAAQALTVPIKPQFYGSVNGLPAWFDATEDSVSTFAPLADVRFSPCAKLPASTAACRLALTVDGTTVGQFDKGVGNVKLKAPGVGSSGWVYMWLGPENVGAPVWLPSVRGVLTYGTVSARPYTYLREIY